jgi:hypothetical protein
MNFLRRILNALRPGRSHAVPDAPRRTPIEHEVRRRGISSLYHFTRAENVAGILREGLLPRNALPPDALISDLQRLDGRPHTVSISVSHPNSKMFYAKRCNGPEDAIWVVLELSPSVLFEKRCVFSHTNAASSSVSSRPEDELVTPEAFCSIFKRGLGQEDMPLDIASDGQAEVLVIGAVESRYIIAVHVMRASDIGALDAGSVPVRVTQRLFYPHDAHKPTKQPL